MATERDVLEQLRVIVEGSTPETPRYDGAGEFRRAAKAYSGDAARVRQSPTRRFTLELTGSRQTVGPQGQTYSPISVIQEIALVVLYRQVADADEFKATVAEDVGKLAWRLETPALWSPATSGIENVTVSDYVPDIDESGPGGVAAIVIPLKVRYLPTYT